MASYTAHVWVILDCQNSPQQSESTYNPKMLNSLSFSLNNFWAFVPLFLIGQQKDLIGNGGEREGMTCSKGLQGGIKPVVAAAGTQPPYMRRPLNQRSYQTTQNYLFTASDQPKPKTHRSVFNAHQVIFKYFLTLTLFLDSSAICLFDFEIPNF